MAVSRGFQYLRGHTVMLTLNLQMAYGYGTAHRLKPLSRDAVQPTQRSPYPALHRLERRGYLKSEWRQSETGRNAKFYSLTRKCERQLAVEKHYRNRSS
jgi:PadR family transcriptional regulator PadR